MEEKLTVFQLEPGKIYKREGYSLIYKITENKELIAKRQDYGDYDFVSCGIRYNDASKPIFTEVKREIDWTKVPRMTKVQVRDCEDKEWINNYFIGYSGYIEGYYPYLATAYYDDDFTDVKSNGMGYNFCRIHPSVAIPAEWYKEL